MNERARELRESLGLSQREFSQKINIGQSTLAMLETGQRIMKDIHVSQICSVFNVSENWLRYGEGAVYVQTENFSLDEYAKQNKLSDLEMDIIKGYISLDVNTRKTLISHFKSIFDNHNETAMTKEDYIDRELEDYRLELEAEEKGQMSSALPDTEEKDA